MNVSPSTISREIKRNSGHNGHNNWEMAQRNDFHPAAFATILGISVLSIRP
ncbi:MAG: helix-turn-helix domain-containing protein [Prevotella sp.]|nr:helix-turn-helix domain-containing protein [Prevotella sp.]